MNTAIEEATTTEKPKATKKARVGAQGAHVAPKRAKSSKKASPPKKAPKATKGAKAAKKKAKAYFGQVADDKDPHAERAKAIARIEGAVSFLSKVDDHIAWQRSEDRSDSHIDGVTRTLKEYSKTLHAIDVAEIKSGHISPVLSAIRSGRGKAAARNSRAIF